MNSFVRKPNSTNDFWLGIVLDSEKNNFGCLKVEIDKSSKNGIDMGLFSSF